MKYTSTRNSSVSVDSADAIARGISPDGGLYAPCDIPQLTLDDIRALADMDYCGRAVDILRRYLTDFSDDELRECVKGAYVGKFGSEQVAPVVRVGENKNILELWHGPTSAFKDMALQLLPHLLTRSVAKTGSDKETVILVATSGDTGKAALEGFADVPGTRIIVFYPEDGVSNIQKLQMTTQSGANVQVCAVKGNFDDAQTGVKAIFTDPALIEELDGNGMAFSSANSINWGRLAPQIVYYVSAYADMVKAGTISCGDIINIVVPTGNFGNILAAYYAKCMGLPVGKLICASNANNVLTDFIRTGVYDRNREFYTTISPSMDILISSNLERLLYHLTDGDSARVSEWMASLKATGRYEVDDDVKAKVAGIFAAGCCDDAQTKAEIRRILEDEDYLADTHTAVALRVFDEYTEATGDKTPAVIASTASPFKFSPSVYSAIAQIPQDADEFELIGLLSERSGYPVPKQLAELKEKDVRFTRSCEKSDMRETVRGLLGLK